MLTLSIQQPWAWAICSIGKDVENRSWATKIRGQILIHAGKRVDEDGYDYLYDEWRVEAPDKKVIERGGIVGTTELYDCVTSSNSPWFFGPNGLLLRGQRPLKFMPLRGQLGFFDVIYTGDLNK